MKPLEISLAARDFILSLDWQGIMLRKGMDHQSYVPAIVWMSPLDSRGEHASGLGLGPMDRSEVPANRFVVCQGTVMDIAQLVPEEKCTESNLVDLGDEGLIFVQPS